MLTVVGERGTVDLIGGAVRGFQAGGLELRLDGAPVAVAAGEFAGLPDSAVGVAGTWASLRDAITSRDTVLADFEHASRLTRLVDVLRASDEDGRRLVVAPDGSGSI